MMDQKTPVVKEGKPPVLARQAGTMRKWLQLTARKQSKKEVAAVNTENDAAQAAADAIAQMLGDARRHG